MAQKTNKSVAKRVKITSTGKALVRKPGLNHFNARSSRSKLLAKKGLQSAHLSAQNLAWALPHNKNL